MDSLVGDASWALGRRGTVCRTHFPVLLLLLVCGAPTITFAQADTTQVTPRDSAVVTDTTTVSRDTVDAPPDTTGAPASDTTQAKGDATTPTTPRGFADPIYGRPVIDSLPALTPHAGLEHVLAQDPGSFLYDLGNVGWPHGWSLNGHPPHRSRLWIEGRPYNSPLTGRPRFDLLPPSFLERPDIGVGPGGSAIGVHTAWRAYDQTRPITELRFRRDSNGLKAIEVGHSQKYRLSLFDRPGILQISGGYGGRATSGPYAGTSLRRERRIWGRLRYQREEWAVQITDLSSRHRIGAHSGVLPPEDATFPAIYLLPACKRCVQNIGARRNTFRNDLTARVRGPVVPGLKDPLDVAATWTSNTFDFQTAGDTTWTTKLNGGHTRIHQPVQLGPHHVDLDARATIWNTAASNIPQIGGARWATHAHIRDSVRVGPAGLTMNVGWHVTEEKQYPSAAAQIDTPVGPFDLTGSVSLAEQQASWFEDAGYSGLIQPLPDGASAASAPILEGTLGVQFDSGPYEAGVRGFAHRVDRATDLYAPLPADTQRVASADTVFTRQTSQPVQRVGATLSAGWRKEASRGLYLTAHGTAVTVLNDRASRLHARLARTLPTLFGKARLGARFVFFEDLITDLYVQVRGWSALGSGWNSRWFHPPTGRFVVPPLRTPLPVRPNRSLGTNGTADVHAEIKLRGATLFFTFENVQASFAPPGTTGRQATLQNGTFVVPIYPLPARQFRFGVHWPIFD